eukprot:scpid62862/ scgid30376/ Serine/threonine-protein kinase-transforming protein Rmil
MEFDSSMSDLDKLKQVQQIIRMYLETKERLEQEFTDTSSGSTYDEEYSDILRTISEHQAQERLLLRILPSRCGAAAVTACVAPVDRSAICAQTNKRKSKKVSTQPRGPRGPGPGAQRKRAKSVPSAHSVLSSDVSVDSESASPESRRTGWKDWEVVRDDVHWGQRIGAGAFGTVFKGYWHGDVAIKVLNVAKPSPSQILAFRNEISVLRKTRHTNVLFFVGCIVEPSLAIITQWCEGSSLYQHLHVNELQDSMQDLTEIARQTALAMEYLHARRILHRDLKSNNIFLLEDKTVKVGDFGLATIQMSFGGDGKGKISPAGSILWMAPEIIRMKPANPYSYASDVYAFGIVMYELMSSELPYTQVGSRDQLLFMIGNGLLRPSDDKARKDTPRAFKQLFRECACYDREKRPLFPYIHETLKALGSNIPKFERSRSLPNLTDNS